MRRLRMVPMAMFVPLVTALLVGVPVSAGDAVSETARVHNPKVQPGDVQWHADFVAACAQAAKSGKPVLLFQMMGNLDEAFT